MIDFDLLLYWYWVIILGKRVLNIYLTKERNYWVVECFFEMRTVNV